MGLGDSGVSDPVVGGRDAGMLGDCPDSPVALLLEHDRKLAAGALIDTAKPVHALQCLLGEINEKHLAELLESQSKEIELLTFVASYITKDTAHEALFNKAADFRNKCLSVATLLREIECEVDRLAMSAIKLSEGAKA
jgi:hypothetical protein